MLEKFAVKVIYGKNYCVLCRMTYVLLNECHLKISMQISYDIDNLFKIYSYFSMYDLDLRSDNSYFNVTSNNWKAKPVTLFKVNTFQFHALFMSCNPFINSPWYRNLSRFCIMSFLSKKVLIQQNPLVQDSGCIESGRSYGLQ